MARIRTIKPSFFTDLKVADLPVTARLTFIGLWTYVDDEGRGVDDPRLVKAALWPLDEEHSARAVEADLLALEQAGRILRYTVDGERFMAVANWSHQRINRPAESSLPPPPEPGDERVNDHGGLTGPSLLDREGNRDRETGTESARERSRSAPRKAAPEQFEISDALRAWAGEHSPTVNLEVETERFLNWARANAKRYADWPAAWRNWMSRAPQYASNGRRPSHDADFDLGSPMPKWG